MDASANIIKKKGKDIFQIKFIKYHKKKHYSNKCPQNLKKKPKN